MDPPVPLPASQIRERTLWVATALGVLTASFIVTKTGRDALYFQARGLYQLPFAYLGITALASPVALLTLSAMRRLGPRATRLLAPTLMTTVVAWFAVFGRPGGGVVSTAFFMLVPLAWGILFSLAWLLLSDFLEDAPSDRVGPAYARVGAGSILGGVLGGLLVRLAAEALLPNLILGLGAGLLALAVGILAGAQKRFPPPTPVDPSEQEPAGSNRSPDASQYRALFRNPYASLLLAIALFGALTGVLVEFQFYLTAATSDNTSAENARFFASFYLILNGAALLVQLVLMPWLQRRVGVHGSLMILPLVLVGGAAALVLLGASAVLRSGLRVTEGGLKSSIHRSNWEQAYLPVDRARRAGFKILIDGMGARTGEGIAAALLFLWLQLVVGDGGLAGQSTVWVTVAMLVSAVTWVALTGRLRGSLQPVVSAPDCVPAAEARVPDT